MAYHPTCNQAAKEFEFSRPLVITPPNEPASSMNPIGVAALNHTVELADETKSHSKVNCPPVLAAAPMVLKPSEESPRSAILFAEMMDEGRFS